MDLVKSLKYKSIFYFKRRLLMKNNLYIIPGSQMLPMAQGIANFLKSEEGNGKVIILDTLAERFADGEPSIKIKENLRRKHVYILKSTSAHFGINFMEMASLIDAAMRAGAGYITAVMPYYGGARQDRKVESRVPITAALAAKLLKAAGANALISVDLHAAQIQGFFDGPFDNIFMRPTIIEYIKSLSLSKIVIVSPDEGGMKRVEEYAKRLNCPVAVASKTRDNPDAVGRLEIISGKGVIKGATCFIIDDIASTGNTLAKAAEALKNEGAEKIYAFCTHAVLPGSSIETIENSCINTLLLSDTIPLQIRIINSPKVKIISVIPTLAKTLSLDNDGLSVSQLFD